MAIRIRSLGGKGRGGDNSKAHKALVAACLKLLKLRGLWAWDNQTHGYYHPVRKCFVKAKDSETGASDILGQFPDRTPWRRWAGLMLAVEAKTGEGELTALQRLFLDTVNANGGFAVCVRDDPRQLDAALTAWGRREEG